MSNNRKTEAPQNRVLFLVAGSIMVLMFLIQVTKPTEGSLVRGSMEEKMDTSIARIDSYGFFDDMQSSDWNLMKQRVKERKNHNDRHLGQRSKVVFLDKPGLWYQNNWEPDFSCKHERRIGGMGPGGRWVCDPHRISRVVKERSQNGGQGCLVYSVAPQGDLKFEYGLRQMLGREFCEIHVFDNSKHFKTYKDLEGLDNVHFHRWGFEPSDKPSNNRGFMTLQETIEALGHEKRVIDIFKIDCDNCEWDIYSDWFNSNVVMMQIIVETHGSPPDANSFFETMQKLNYVTFHKEPNTQFCAGECQSYSFLKLAPSFFD